MALILALLMAFSVFFTEIISFHNFIFMLKMKMISWKREHLIQNFMIYSIS